MPPGVFNYVPIKKLFAIVLILPLRNFISTSADSRRGKDLLAGKDLLVVDYYSKHPEVEVVESKTVQSTNA